MKGRGFAGVLAAMVFAAAASSARADCSIPVLDDVDGYAGPGWSVLFGSDGQVEMASLGPAMFKLGSRLHLGAVVAYEESASEGPGFFLGGIAGAFLLPSLSAGPYSTSLCLALMAGGSGLNDEAAPAYRASAGLDADLLLLPALRLSAGPRLELRSGAGGLAVLPGFAFSLKEGTADSTLPLFRAKGNGFRIGGYWQGLWLFPDGEPAFVDCGGTRLELPSGWAFGITGGVLRQRIRREGSSLAIMQTGLSAEWNWRPLAWLTVAPRLVAGLSLCGWADPSGSMDGGPFFMARPEFAVFAGILPFLELGGSIGYHIIIGSYDAAIPLPSLSSVAFTVQARVGDRRSRR